MLIFVFANYVGIGIYRYIALYMRNGHGLLIYIYVKLI